MNPRKDPHTLEHFPKLDRSGIVHTTRKPLTNIDIVTVKETGEIRYDCNFHTRMLKDIPNDVLDDITGKLLDFHFKCNDEMLKREREYKEDIELLYSR